MYELLLDTANLTDLTEYLIKWPVAGVTLNPSILKKEGNIDVYSQLAKIKKLCGADRSLHVQVVSNTTEAIVEEAHRILDRLGRDVYIKIPVSAAGLPAIKQLADQNINITATAIYSTLQGIMAALSGAKYIAVYYNRMENNCTDPNAVIREIRSFIDGSGSEAKILAASFKNVGQVTAAYASGAQSVTVGVDIIKSGLGMASIDSAVEGFAKDFEAIHGSGQTMKTISE
ncbi:fructose-6-phosphate aldolase [Caproiciproducens sp. CPB-2]|uniref:fructose-6-phosphate aldolase n=1 Tax=Caproiciproducens sp. CPB-2 TaxID=3030017 RepID=UPI0023DC6D30|nr:fructose-6-phosphate aldolase [Caproiciproducens sp. CPB-2]MDF1494823.1 fructose-6-phosphate aldolase [Caproiciproducens sp. CPB-2]